MAMTLEQTEQAIFDLYHAVHAERPNTRLDPNVGPLGALWAQFDQLVATE